MRAARLDPLEYLRELVDVALAEALEEVRADGREVGRGGSSSRSRPASVAAILVERASAESRRRSARPCRPSAIASREVRIGLSRIRSARSDTLIELFSAWAISMSASSVLNGVWCSARIDGARQRLVRLDQSMPGALLVVGEEGADEGARFVWTGPSRGAAARPPLNALLQGEACDKRCRLGHAGRDQERQLESSDLGGKRCRARAEQVAAACAEHAGKESALAGDRPPAPDPAQPPGPRSPRARHVAGQRGTASVVTFGRDAAHHDGHRYASRLRQASVDVEELRYDAPEHPDVVPPGDGGGDRLVCDLARSIHGTRVDQGPQHLQPGERGRLGVTSQ
jgi:hypothetical protein